MNQEVKDLLDEAIIDSILELNGLDAGESKEKQASAIEKLVTASVRIADQELKDENSLVEFNLKRREVELKEENDKKIPWLEILKAAVVPVGVAFLGASMRNQALKTVLKFEETGSIVSSGGRNVLSSVLK